MTNTSACELRLTLLGTPRIELGGDLVPLPRRRTRALLYFLAASPRRHNRDELVDLVWPNLAPAKGRRQLSDALTDLRRTLGADLVDGDAGGVAATVPHCDAIEFAGAVEAAGRLPGSDSEAALLNAVNLYGGEFLAGLAIDGSEAFEAWVQEQRLSFSVSALGAHARLAMLRLDAGDPSSAIRIAQRGLGLDNLREDLWRIVIQARADLNDRQGALAEYVRCRDTLQREIGVAPDAETEALRRRVSAERGTAAAGPFETQAAKARSLLPTPLRLPGSSLPLVGRERELATLLRAWECASEGAGGLAAIEGEPGIGKSRLAVEFVLRAARAGATVLSSRCPDLPDPAPYGPFEEAVRAHLPSMPSGAFKELGVEWQPWAGRPVPELGLGVELPPTLTPEEEKARLSESAGRVLDLIARDCPLLFVVEDIHWAHPATVQLLHTIARRPRPMLILTTMRDTEPQTEGTLGAVRMLDDLASEDLVARISLRPLPVGDTESLVKLALEAAGGESRPSATAIAKLADGRPLFALELTRGLLDSPHAPDLPASLVNAIGARVAHASTTAQRVLELAAVVARPVTLQLLSQAMAPRLRPTLLWTPATSCGRAGCWRRTNVVRSFQVTA